MQNYIGLTTKEASASAKQHGKNTLTKKARPSFLRKYLASFGDPIIRILLVALGVNLLLIFRDSNWYESAGIAVAVLLATLISTLSEYGSESAFDKLQEEAANIKCRVRRDGKILEIPIAEIVVGDIVYLQAGEKIPADGVIVSGEIDVDQSALNGESKEITKKSIGNKKYDLTKLIRISEKDDFLSASGIFRGAVVCAGEATACITRVGDASFYGQLAIEIQEEKIDSPLKNRLGQLAKTISRFGYAAAAVVFFANLFNSIVIRNSWDTQQIIYYLSDYTNVIRDLMMAITLGITVIVMAVPEGLPMMITVVLSANMRRMLKDNVLVRKLVGIETSGNLNILFTDKTGTLTKGQLEVVSFVSPEGIIYDTKKSPIIKSIALNCFYNNSAMLTSKKMVVVATGGNSTDRALLEYVKKYAPKLPLCQKGFVKPFNSSDKFSTTVITGEATRFLLKGAPEILLPSCKYALNETREKRIFSSNTNLKNVLQKLAQDGKRILAFCEADNETDAKSKQNLTLVGFVGIRDEIRNEAKKAIIDVKDAGVQVVMVTGDNLDTAVGVAEKLGLTSSGDNNAILTSKSLNNKTDEEVKKILPGLRVVARALPSDKGRLVRLSQEMGLVAGMTGDGVNDAPALKKSDVGFTMGDGTEIAKEAGDIVILDNNFASIVKAVLYGRTIFKSIRKFLIFQLTINLCAVLVSVIGPFIGIPVPVTVIQMLWINMIMDTLAGLAYAGETPLNEYMKEKPKKRSEPIINKYMLNQILTTGVYTSLLGLAFLSIPFFHELFRSDERYLLTAFFALFIFAGVFNSLNARTYRINIFSYLSRNKMFILIMLAVLVMQILLIYFGGAVFRTTGLSLYEFFIVILLASTVVLFDLVRKIFLRINKRKGFI